MPTELVHAASAGGDAYSGTLGSSAVPRGRAFSASEVAVALGYKHTMTVYKKRRNGTLHARRKGRNWVFYREDNEELFCQREAEMQTQADWRSSAHTNEQGGNP